MTGTRTICRLLTLVGALSIGNLAVATGTLQERVAESLRLWDGAEARFEQPDIEWFEATRAALVAEVERVDKAMESQGPEYAAAWKKHLRWPLLVRNLGQPADVNYSELALVRRWMFSNREGLEYEFFAELRDRMEAHLDAAYVFTQRDLRSTFDRQVVEMRIQLQALAAEPSDAHAADLGRTLGWFEQTRQLTDEVAATRSLLSSSNARIVVSKSLIDRAIAKLATDVQQTLPVSDRVQVPKGSLLGRPRTACVNGMATTHGQIAVQLEENDAHADVRLVYRGEVESRCRAIIGPLRVSMKTVGPVIAFTPVHIGLQGVQAMATQVEPQVDTRVTGVYADSRLVRRLGERRVRKPESMQQMNSRATQKAATLIKEEMDQRITTVLNDIRNELKNAKTNMDGFREVLAPVEREGASPRWDKIVSSADEVVVHGLSQRREQFGAATPYPEGGGSADVQIRLHVSFFNNMLETIMAGKTFTDKYFMNYGKILQAQLPPQLMVHARSVRWAVIADKPRPLEITIPEPNHFRMVLRMQRVKIGDEEYTGPTTATIHYRLVKNEFDEYRLERQGDFQLESLLPAEQHKFLQGKLGAFFAPVLDAGGVALPEGGRLGRLSSLQPQEPVANQDWITLGMNIPDAFLEEWLEFSGAAAAK